MLPMRYDTTLEIIEAAFDKYSSENAYTCEGHTITFAEVATKSYAFASYLQNDLNLKPGDRIAIQLPNVLQFPIVFYGAILAGLVVVNTNPLYTSREILHQLKDSGAKALVVLANIAHKSAEIIDKTAVESVILTEFADIHPQPKRLLINLALRYIYRSVPKFSYSCKVLPLLDCLANDGSQYNRVMSKTDQVMMLQYTGGTTGISKGAMLTQGSLATNVWQLVSHMPRAFREKEEVFIACLPLYHIYALNIHLLSSFGYGGHNILIPNPRDIPSFVKAIRSVGFTAFVGINTLFNALSRNKEFQSTVDFSRLHVCCSGGMALTEDALHTWESVTGSEICEGYGLTETSPVVCAAKVGEAKSGYVGTAVPETELKVVDDDGNSLPRGEVGELCVRGPQLMKGYWQRPDETEKVMTADGWFKTGDLVEICENGLVKIVDRKKDMIIVSGFNVYPNEIEDVVCQHPDIIEAAALGVPHKESGEIVKLFVVAGDPELSEQDVVKYCKKYLTAYKVPKQVEFCKELPKSNIGKILRRKLRDEEPLRKTQKVESCTS